MDFDEEGAVTPGLTLEEQLTLARALFQRTNRDKDARVAIAKAYPNAPEAMIHTAVHHLYVDGSTAALEFLADLERCLQEPGQRPDLAVAIELLYHVYNWQQFEALLPGGRADVLELVSELKGHLADNDIEATRVAVEELSDMLEGSKNPPDIR
jgi:hypothetical protein